MFQCIGQPRSELGIRLQDMKGPLTGEPSLTTIPSTNYCVTQHTPATIPAEISRSKGETLLTNK